MSDAVAVMMTTLDYYEKRLQDRDAIIQFYREATQLNAIIQGVEPATVKAATAELECKLPGILLGD